MQFWKHDEGFHIQTPLQLEGEMRLDSNKNQSAGVLTETKCESHFYFKYADSRVSDKNGQIFSGEDSNCLEVKFARLYGEFEWKAFKFRFSLQK